MRVSIQGVRGAFHEIAARLYFGDHIQIVPALSFEETVQCILPDTDGHISADAAIMAIENTIAGTILGNYHLIQNLPVQITGEVFIPIRQNLLALPGVTITDIQEVHSHPMALAQCEAYLAHYPHIKLIESEDTAASAAFIVKHQMKQVAAIGSTLAAEVYGLDILAPSIETHHENFTRFWIVEPSDRISSKNAAQPAAFYKISVSFVAPHQRGSLAHILTTLAQLDANLTKIQSVPLVGRPWEYLFFLDFTIDTQADYEQIVSQLKQVTTNLTILGKYAAGVPSNSSL